MNYIGSKKRLLEFIKETIKKDNPDLKNLVFCDLFSGTGTVGEAFQKLGCKLISNDNQYYSFVINQSKLNHHDTDFKKLQNLIKEMNDLKGEELFITSNYSVGGSKNQKYNRNYFTRENALKIDAARNYTNQLFSAKKINESEKYVLIHSILKAADKVANTASVYAAYLKKVKKTALNEIFFELPIDNLKNKAKVYCEDANVLIEKIQGDILYLDPPYNQRQYASNYHILETISRWDNPSIRGKTGLRDYQKQKSLWSSKTAVKSVFEDLIKKANFKYIYLSYNSEGLLSEKEIMETLNKYGEVKIIKKKYLRFKSRKEEQKKYVTEFLYKLKKDL